MRLILQCGAALFVSGYAFQTLSFSMPGLIHDWRLDPALIGPLLSAAIFGLLVGYVFVAPLADRLGERRIVSGAMLGLAIATACSVTARGIETLFVARVLIGVAIGTALPGAVSVASQNGPQRWRGAQVVGIYVAFSLGFLAAGIASGWLVPRFGWRAPWGLTIPAALAAALLLWNSLPERSIRSQTTRPLPALFDRPVRLGTLLFWAMFAIGLGLFYALQSWLPLLGTREGWSYSNAVTASSLFTLGTAVGALPMIWCADRMGPFRALIAMNGVGLAGIILLGISAAHGGVMFHIAALVSGIGIGAGQKGLIAAASLFYPPSIRATGLGWGLGVGRLGAACGPLLIGFLTMREVDSGTALLCLASPVPLVMIAAIWLERAYGRIDQVSIGSDTLS